MCNYCISHTSYMSALCLVSQLHMDLNKHVGFTTEAVELLWTCALLKLLQKFQVVH